MIQLSVDDDLFQLSIKSQSTKSMSSSSDETKKSTELDRSESPTTKQQSSHKRHSTSNNNDSMAVRISAVTGQEWIESISATETVNSLKQKIWQRSGLLPYHQGLIFSGELLSDDEALISLYGITSNSTIRLVILTRSGPLSVQEQNDSGYNKLVSINRDEMMSSEAKQCKEEKVGRVFDEKFLDENRRTLFKMCELRRQMRRFKNEKEVVPRTSEPSSRVCVSAPEDTSAKESSIGDDDSDEYDYDDDESNDSLDHHNANQMSSAQGTSHNQLLSSNIYFNNSSSNQPSTSNSKIVLNKKSRQIASKGYDNSNSNTNGSICNTKAVNSSKTTHKSMPSSIAPQKRLLLPTHNPDDDDSKRSPFHDCHLHDATHSDDGCSEEVSSGMIICDLSYDFRRLRVRRKHHTTSNNATTSSAFQKTNRARSKPRNTSTLCSFANNKNSDITTSSDDERQRQKPSSIRRKSSETSCNLNANMMPSSSILLSSNPSALRRSWWLSRSVNNSTGNTTSQQQRCNACAVKLNTTLSSIAFQCRCGKTLCARHRAPDMHTCTRLRKLQDVSD